MASSSVGAACHGQNMAARLARRDWPLPFQSVTIPRLFSGNMTISLTDPLFFIFILYS
jgi:hypothetical protein